MTVSVRVTSKGPLFDGRAQAQVRAFQDAAEQELAKQALAIVRARLAGAMKRPTGHYLSMVQITDTQVDDLAVTDNAVVYGPWLEGVSSRNRSTRFRGYAAFRRAQQEIQARAGEIGERVLPPYLRRMQ
jgi:hypothetical protein